jgi:O-antigen/teichoic acid export membrane protein
MKLFLQNKLIKNIVIVMGGAAGAQVIAFLALPIITRIYTPTAIGVLGSFLAILAVLVPIATLSYPLAIVLPKNNSEALKLAHLSILTTFTFSVIVFIVLVLGYESFSVYLGFQPDDASFLTATLPFALLFTTLLTVLTQWLIRHKLFTLIAKATIAQSITINSLKILVGLLLPLGKTLIFITVVGTFLHSLIVIFLLKQKKDKKLWLPITANYNKDTAKSYKDFPKYRTPHNILANLTQSLPILLLVLLFGPIYAGLYTLCRSTLLVPVTLVGKSVNDVLFPQLNEAYTNNKPVTPLLFKATKGLLLLALPPLIFFIAVGPQAFTFVFGDMWQDAGIISQWVAVRYYFVFINRACVSLLPVLKLEKFLLFNGILNFLLSVLGFYLGYYLFNDPIYAIALYSILGVIPQLLIIVYVITKAKGHDIQLKKNIVIKEEY